MRTWLKRLTLFILILTGVYLVAANLFLNSPLAPRAFSRHPAKFRIAWSSAWTLWPGLVRVRGLRLRGHVHDVTWRVDAERGSGWIDLDALLHRTLRVREIPLDEVRCRVLRGPEQETPEDREKAAEPDAPPHPHDHPWTLTFTGIRLAHIREFDFNEVRLTGDGTGGGAFKVVIGRSFRLEPSFVRMPSAQLALGDEPIARKAWLDAEASLGPYAPHDHPGLEGFDFLSGSLRMRGEVPDLPFLDRARLVAPGRQVPGALVSDLRFDHGRLVPGSRLDITAPAAGPASPFAIAVTVTGGPGNPLFHLGIDAKGLTAGRRPHSPPLFQAATLTVDTKTPETRLSRLFATARDLRDPDKPAVTLPLTSDLRATGVRIEAPGSRATLHAALDRATGRIDLAGLLDGRIDVRGLDADGVDIRLGFAGGHPAAKAPPAAWAVRMAGLHLTGIREIAVGDYRVAGTSQADLAFSYAPDGVLAVPRAAFRLPTGRFDIAGETVARGLSAKVEARVDPTVLGATSGLAVLRLASGTVALKAGISSLGFLRPYLVKTSWLGLQGKGTLDADARLDHGRLTPGSHLTVVAAPIQARIFDSQATGRGTVRVAVAGQGAAGRTEMRVRLDRFVVEDLRQAGWPDYLRGQGLRFDAVLPAALDLTAPMQDFDATLDLPDAEVPDLTVYDALLPREGGLWIVSGRGRARLHLEASTATNRTRGTAILTSDDARVRFQNLELAGRLDLQAPLASPDLAGRRFDLAGTHLTLDGVSWRNVEARSEAEAPGWWARADLTGGSVIWGTPLSLRGEGKVDMQSSTPLIALFAERSRFLRWFDAALKVENVAAQGVVRLGGGKVEIESLQATGGPLEVRSRMIFAKTRRAGDLYLRYGRLAAGIELRDGRRTYKLRQPLDWYESRPQP
ncbi:MAG TPA: hypothetical protein VGG20_18410 [Thermoanaerobaculia bacterium]